MVLRLECHGKRKCDFTKLKLKNKEPRMVIGPFHIKTSSSKDFIKCVKSESSKDKNLMIYNTSVGGELNHDCIYCDMPRRNMFILRKRYSPPKCVICSSCMDSLINDIENLDNLLDKKIIEWSESGFCIRKVQDKKRMFFSGREVSESYVLEIGAIRPDYVKLSNISELKENLLEARCPVKIDRKCSLCNNRKSKKSASCSIEGNNGSYSICFHKKCRDDILGDLKKVEETNKRFLTSQII